jgi:hypothetical protein
MKITFADSFFESLERLNAREKWWYKLYDLFRYHIPNFFRNIWLFRKELFKFRWYDYNYTLEMFSRSISIMENGIDKKSHEVLESKNLKLNQMRRAIEILNNLKEFNYIEKAEKEMGKLKDIDIFTDNNDPNDIEYNNRIYNRAEKLQEIEWNELWDIIKGTNKLEHDGTDIRSWWD